MAEDPGEQTFLERFNALREEYLAALPQRRADVAAQWAACAQDPQSAAWRELHTAVHRLSGSAPCYGLEDVGAAAHALDCALSGKSPCRDPATLAPMIAGLLRGLDAWIGGA